MDILNQFDANLSFIYSNIPHRNWKVLCKLLQTRQNLFDIEKFMKVWGMRFKLKINTITFQVLFNYMAKSCPYPFWYQEEKRNLLTSSISISLNHSISPKKDVKLQTSNFLVNDELMMMKLLLLEETCKGFCFQLTVPKNWFEN